MSANRVSTDMFYNRQQMYSRMINPDFVQLARSMGAHAIRVRSASELPEKMKHFLEYDGNRPVLLDCVMEPRQHLYPLVCPRSMINLVTNLGLLCRFHQARHYMNRFSTLRFGIIKRSKKAL